MNIPKDAARKTAGQRDREARQAIEKERTRIARLLLALLVAAGAVIVFTVWTAVTN